MATSASVHTNSWDGRTITLLVEEISTSIEDNTSTVRWTLTSGTSSTYHNVYEVTAWVGGTADSNKVYGPKTATWDTRAFPCKDGSTSGTIIVPHNADGSYGTYPFRLRGSVRNNSPQNYDGSITLTTIPRASTFTVSGGTLGSTISVSITRASSTFKHKVYCKLGSRSQTISSSAETSASATLSMDFANGITTGNSSGVATATATMYVETYSGSTLVGTKSSNFTMTVPTSVVPTISSVTKSDTAGYLSTHGAYVQGKSNLRIQTSSSGAYSSSISSVTVYIKNSSNTTLRTLTGSDVTLSGISYTGTLTIQVVVKDSRNRTATNSSTITVATYENPKITTFTAERLNNDSTITVKINASITNVNNHNSNAKHFYMWIREKGTYNWGSAVINYSSAYTYNNTSSPYTISKDENKSWQFMLEVSDSFSVTSQVIDVGTVFELINWGSNGTTMAIGKVANTSASNTLEVALDTELKDIVSPTGRLTSPDFDHQYPNGKISKRFDICSGSMNNSANKPSSDGYLETFFWDNDGTYDAQLLIPNTSGNLQIRTRSNGTAWQNNWKFIPVMDNFQTGDWEPKYQNCTYTHYSSYKAHYIRIGNMVILIFHDRPNITPGSSPKAQIGGLPFTPAWPQQGSGSLGTSMITNTNYIPSVTISNAGYIELCNNINGSQLVEWKTTTNNSSWIDGFVIYWCA